MRKVGYVIILFFVLSVTGCSSHGIKKDMSLGNEISSLQSTGIIIRLSDKSIISHDEYSANITAWLESAKKIKKVILAGQTSAEINSWSKRDGRLYQVSLDGEYQKYKALGVGRVYLRDHGIELKKIMEDNNLDSLVIFEADGMVSREMQFLDMESAVLLVKRDMSILYMDHASENIDVDVSEDASLRRMLMDRLSTRLLYTLKSFDFIRMD